MSRTAIPLEVHDLSAFAKSIREHLQTLGHVPSHVELLNAIAKAVGFRNYQHLRADAGAQQRIVAAAVPPQPVDHQRLEKVARHFDASGRLLRWPARAGHADLCLWVLWSHVPAEKVLSEREIGKLLNLWHVFGDHALLRRALFDARLVDRTRDGREYRRIEQKPPAELRVLLSLLGKENAKAA